MGVEPLIALPPGVLVAGRLQCGAARAGVHRGHGECAELAHLARGSSKFFRLGMLKTGRFLVGLGKIRFSQRAPRPARAGAAARRRPGRSVSRRGLARWRCTGHRLRGKWKCGGGSHSDLCACAGRSRAGRGDHYLCGLTDKHISRIEQLLLPLKRRALIWALRPYPWRAWRIPACPQPAKTVHWIPSGYYLRGA